MFNFASLYYLVAVSVTISIPINCLPVTESGHSPTIFIADGCIQGKADESYEAFLGIPFAEAPLGNLRFSVSKICD